LLSDVELRRSRERRRPGVGRARGVDAELEQNAHERQVDVEREEIAERVPLLAAVRRSNGSV